MEEVGTIIGIDEAGRGPLAGPVYVAAVKLGPDADLTQFLDLADSKQMTEDQREHIYDQVISEEPDGISWQIIYSRAKTIDKHGINQVIKQCINRCLRRLDFDADSTKVLLDGGLSAPQRFQQETLVGGDEKVPAISLASVLAKVARDRYMKKVNSKYEQFNFKQHKGYGTKKHRENIKTHGPSHEHRQTFIADIR